VTAIPANPFGPGDDTSGDDGHVIGALLRRLHHAKEHGDAEVVVWGTGKPRRDFLYVDDLADALVFLMQRYESDLPINVSSGSDVSIGELAQRIQELVGFRGRLRFDASRPDGAPRKVLDGEPLRRLGFTPRTPLDVALAETYRWLLREGLHG
jgi:GDP-L-fucose synthase